MSSQSGMPGATESGPAKKWVLWTGRVLSAAPILIMAFAGAMKLSHAQQVVDAFVGVFGFPESALMGIGMLEIACAIVYAIPRTSVLGAILVTCYFGSAV